MAWTEEQYRDLQRKRAAVNSANRFARESSGIGSHRPRKYKNQPVEFQGMQFDSKKEATVYQTLKLRELAGEISHLRRQVSFPIYAYERKTQIARVVAFWIADFVYLQQGQEVRVDVKGGAATKTQLYRLKKAILEVQDGIPIMEM